MNILLSNYTIEQNTQLHINSNPNTSKIITYDFVNRKVINQNNVIENTTQPKKETKPMGRPKNNPNLPSMPVQPIKSEEGIQQAIEYFLSRPERYKGTNIRDCAVFAIGINVLERASDLLNLRWEYLLDNNYEIKNHLTIIQQKTKSKVSVPIIKQTREAINLYYNYLIEQSGSVQLTDPIFPSREKDDNGDLKGMTVSNFYKKMQGLKKELDLNCPIGTHTIRKTLPYLIWRENKDDPFIIQIISNLLGHKNIETTLTYLSIQQEEMDSVLNRSGKGSMMRAMNKFGYSVEM